MPLCFVIGPIGKDNSPERKHSDLLLHTILKEVLEKPDLGYTVKRADEDADPGMIGDRVITDIINAELVVADLTDLNPNVFYELGIRHSTEKPTIHIAKTGTQLPFDTVSQRTIFVDLSDRRSIIQARERLTKAVSAIEADGYKVSNPITQANASFQMRHSEDPRDQVIAQLSERMAILESTVTHTEQNINKQRLNELSEHYLAAALAEWIRSGQLEAAQELYYKTTPATEEQAKKFIENIVRGTDKSAILLHQSATFGDRSSARWFVESLRNRIGERPKVG